MSTPPTLKAPLHLLNEKRILEYLRHFTSKTLEVEKDHNSITLYLDGQKVYIPILPNSNLIIEPQDLVDSLKEKGLIP
jgi:hypothetical protein